MEDINGVNQPLNSSGLLGDHLSGFVFRKTGIWRYTPQATWCLVWNVRCCLCPSFYREEVHGGWWLHWLWFMFEKFAFDDDDPWGERRGEEMCDVLGVIANELDCG